VVTEEGPNGGKVQKFHRLADFSEIPNITERFQQIVTGVVEYFELFKQNADKLEHIIFELVSKMGYEMEQSQKTFI
jgi:hypothetical protein